jgi:hypothetical protein
MACPTTAPEIRARALTAVAGALAEVGQHEQAITMACSITAPETQAQALTVVAKALAARGSTGQARHVASAACAVGTMDDGAGTSVVAGAVGAQSARRAVIAATM